MAGRSEIRVEPATRARWADVVTVFGTRGDPSWCWCQYFMSTGDSYFESATANRSALHRQVATATVAPGLLAYLQEEPVGWVQVGPRAAYPRVGANRRLAKVADADGDGDDVEVWRTTCFVVRVGYRRRGVATALLAAALDHARTHGATAIEGHPVDGSGRSSKPSSAELYHGAASMFLAAGFTEIGRTTPSRPVMRLSL